MSSKKKGNSSKKKNGNLGQKLVSGATTAEDNSTLAGIDSAYGITLDDLRVKADTLLELLGKEQRNSILAPFSEEYESSLRRLYHPATDSQQHSIDASEEMLQFSFESQLNLQAFIDKVDNFISCTPNVDRSKFYRPLLQLYEAAYRSGLQRLNLTIKRAELIGAKERPHLYEKLKDEQELLQENNKRLFEKFTSHRILWMTQTRRWDQLPSQSTLKNVKVLKKHTHFKEKHHGLLTKAVKGGDYKECLRLIDVGHGFVDEEDKQSGATPMHHATWDGRLDIVELLIARDANVNKQTRRGFTALHFAYENRHEDIINFLMANGADENIKSLLDQTPKDMEVIRDAKQLRRRKKNLHQAMNVAFAEEKQRMAAEAAQAKREARAKKKAKKKGK